MNKKKAAIIIPVRNEEINITSCIESILHQTIPLNQLQIVFVDGMSNDNTREILLEYQKRYCDTILIFENPKRIVPTAMNIGIDNTESSYIIRLDAHSEYNENYIDECIKTIEDTGADNVGGLAITKGEGKIGEAFAQVLSSKFGVGNSRFRTGAKSGYVDTVPFGTFKRETFERFGKYDERLARNQDYELNYRIRKNGGRIYLNAEIQLHYICKNTLKGILSQSFENGKWNIITMKLCPGAMSTRHFIPFAFLLSLILLTVGGGIWHSVLFLLAADVGLYVLLDIIFSAINCEKQYKNHFFIKLTIFPLFHLAYGFGSMIGLFSKK